MKVDCGMCGDGIPVMELGYMYLTDEVKYYLCSGCLLEHLPSLADLDRLRREAKIAKGVARCDLSTEIA